MATYVILVDIQNLKQIFVALLEKIASKNYRVKNALSVKQFW